MDTTRSSRRREFAQRGGFSLVELIVVAAVLAIGAGIALPRYNASVTRYRVDAAARRVAADLDRARTAARVTSQPRTVEFKPLHMAYVIGQERSLSRRANVYEVLLSGEPYHIDTMSANFGGAASVTFTAMGVPTSDGEVMVRIGKLERWIVVNAGRSKADIQ